MIHKRQHLEAKVIPRQHRKKQLHNNDLTTELQASVLQALTDKTPLQIIGGNSKSFYGRQSQAQQLSMQQHRGVLNYQPTELVITARAGTLLSEIEQVLAEQKQMLAFEPPHFGEHATLGGTIACALSGPRRAYTGAARDFVLGCKIINGKGEILSFGGEVIKNVAGYDVSRLMVGAFGTLGIILELSLKVLPLPICERSCYFDLDASQALSKMTELSAMCLPISGLCYQRQRLMVRFSGAEKAVVSAIKQCGAEQYNDSLDFWSALSEQQADFFQYSGNLWRLSVPPSTPVLKLAGEVLYDWGGALRWLKTDVSAASVFNAALQAEGHATLFRSQERSGDIFQPLPDTLALLQHNIKKAFDPEAIFNPYRIYRSW